MPNARTLESTGKLVERQWSVGGIGSTNGGDCGVGSSDGGEGGIDSTGGGDIGLESSAGDEGSLTDVDAMILGHTTQILSYEANHVSAYLDILAHDKFSFQKSYREATKIAHKSMVFQLQLEHKLALYLGPNAQFPAGKRTRGRTTSYEFVKTRLYALAKLDYESDALEIKGIVQDLLFGDDSGGQGYCQHLLKALVDILYAADLRLKTFQQDNMSIHDITINVPDACSLDSSSN